MCDDQTLNDNDHALASSVTRRRFGILSSSAALATLLPGVANAKSTSEGTLPIAGVLTSLFRTLF